MTEPLITMVVPYYRQPKMLLKQMDTLDSYPSHVRDTFYVIVVDDGSPEDAERVLTSVREDGHLPHRPDALYRIDEDVPWNRGMARNLGTKMATTPWVLHVDTDHVLPPDSAHALVRCAAQLSQAKWYRFERFRVGAADETRKKDKVNPHATFAKIHPHIDSYLCTKDAYKRAGGYNELFGGVLGGGSPFLKEMEKANGKPGLIEFPLHVYTRDKIPDSSERTLPRDPAAFKKRKQEIMASRGTLKYAEKEWLRLPWHRVF
jgi:hypothetical protein